MLPGASGQDPSGYRGIDEEEKSGDTNPGKSKSYFKKTMTGLKDGASNLVSKVKSGKDEKAEEDAAMYR